MIFTFRQLIPVEEEDVVTAFAKTFDDVSDMNCPSPYQWLGERNPLLGKVEDAHVPGC